MVKRKRRDIYGNWVWEDDDAIKNSQEAGISAGAPPISKSADSQKVQRDSEDLGLDWRDFVALSIASLETFLLPIVVFIIILIGIVVGLSFFR